MKGAKTNLNTSARPIVEVKRDTITVRDTEDSRDHIVISQYQYNDGQERALLHRVPSFDEAMDDQSLETVLSPQSMEKVIYDANDTSQHENVTFTDDTGGFAYDLDDYVDPTRMMQDSDDADLGNFFSRPLKIWNRIWEINTEFQANFDPWSLFFNNPRVVNRISNFNLLRCKLHLKVLVNGTPFHYGSCVLAYNPLDNFDDTALALDSSVVNDVTRFSQMPHIYLNPTVSQGGTMELPFFWHKNYLSVPDAEWVDMGRVYIRVLNTLQHASGGTEPVTISVFAWASDVSLAVPTSKEPSTLAPQASEKPIRGKMKGKSAKAGASSAPQEHTEANSKGIISGPATAIARAAGALKVIPALTPYATAAEFAADTTASIAKLFGFSRPAVVKDPEPYKPVPVSSLALTTVPDMANKLTTDDQQGLTIDTRIAGVGNEDTLTIKGIASRESYLTTFDWQVANSPEQFLWNCNVSPVMWTQTGTGLSTAYYFPACAMASLPFKYWTGSLKFRFQVVKSAFHKGRLKVVYDPRNFATNEYNTNFTEIIDIAEKTDFTITVGNAQTKTLLTHLSPGVDAESKSHSSATALTDSGIGNGILMVRVVNKLTTPDPVSGQTIKVNVFVSAGDDFEVFVPDNDFAAFTFAQPTPTEGAAAAPPPEEPLDPQMAEVEMKSDAMAEGAQAPESQEECFIGPQLQYEDMITRVWIGESIHSFRPMLRRYALHRSLTNGGTADTLIRCTMPIFPFYRGYVNGAVDTTLALDAYNYVNTNIMHWVVMAHAGWRGGIRRKIVKRGQFDYSTLYVQRQDIAATGEVNYSLATVPAIDVTNSNALNWRNVRTNAEPGNSSVPYLGWQGIAYQLSDLNPCMELESPFYSDLRFYPGKQLDYTGTGPKTERLNIRIMSKGKVSSAHDIFVAAAEDFQVYFFTGLPRMYYEATPPAV